MVQNRIAVVTADVNKFWAYMKPFQISNYSKKLNKFWIHKGATEYILVNNADRLGLPLTGIVLLENSWDLHEAYLSAHMYLSKSIVVTEDEEAKEALVSGVLDSGQLIFEQHDELLKRLKDD